VKGIKGIKMPTNFRLKHLGYIDKDLVDKKAEIYRGITTDIETTLQEMYLKNERPIKWIDNRNSMKVILLNHFLTCIQVKNMVPKVISRVSKLLSRRSEAQNSATVTAN
ncbi:MAG TPA: hypothetical protein VF602_12685, partial [Pedobacter sp.]